MWRILSICIVGLLLQIEVGLCDKDVREGFSEIILGEYLKDPAVNRINSLVEEAEETINIDKLKELELILEKKIEEKQKPQFLYYYFLARTYFAFANLYERKQDKKKIREFLEKALPLCKRSIKHNKRFSDSHRLLSDIYGRLIHLKNPIVYGMLYPTFNSKICNILILLHLIFEFVTTY